MTPFRASAPLLRTDIDRRQDEAVGVNVGDAFQTIQTYLGSTYVSQFSRFGHTFPVFVQADTQFRLTFEALGALNVRNAKGAMVPVGTLASVLPGVGPASSSRSSISIRPPPSTARPRRATAPARRSR